MTTSANPSSGVIILQGTENFLEWIYTIEMSAKVGSRDIWKYINPIRSSAESISIPSILNRPTPYDVRQGASTVSDLEGVQVEDYKLGLAEWKENKAEIDEINRQIGAIQNKILGSISERLQLQLKYKSTVLEILIYLNKRFRPTDQAQRQGVTAKWNKLKLLPSDRAVIPWLDKWELTHAEAKGLDLPHVVDPQPQYDFLYAIKTINESWATIRII
ncbi:hypothetical protein HI914_05957 [Erysiphe necator]|nr:hypothetical protein HI914_05957 [Erysiphe necator]